MNRTIRIAKFTPPRGELSRGATATTAVGVENAGDADATVRVACSIVPSSTKLPFDLPPQEVTVRQAQTYMVTFRWPVTIATPDGSYDVLVTVADRQHPDVLDRARAIRSFSIRA